MRITVKDDEVAIVFRGTDIDLHIPKKDGDAEASWQALVAIAIASHCQTEEFREFMLEWVIEQYNEFEKKD